MLCKTLIIILIKENIQIEQIWHRFCFKTVKYRFRLILQLFKDQCERKGYQKKRYLIGKQMFLQFHSKIFRLI